MRTVVLIIDEIHLLGEDRGPVLEVIVSAQISSHSSPEGLCGSPGCPKGIEKKGFTSLNNCSIDERVEESSGLVGKAVVNLILKNRW